MHAVIPLRGVGRRRGFSWPLSATESPRVRLQNRTERESKRDFLQKRWCRLLARNSLGLFAICNLRNVEA